MLTFERDVDGSVRIRERFPVLRVGLLLCALAGVAFAAWLWLDAGAEGLVARRDAMVVSALVLVCAWGATRLPARCHEFDAARREYRWQERSLWRDHRGRLPFHQIRCVELCATYSRDDGASWRESFSIVMRCVDRSALLTRTGSLDRTEFEPWVSILNTLIRPATPPAEGRPQDGRDGAGVDADATHPIARQARSGSALNKSINQCIDNQSFG